jgi:hypothetical protein
MPSNDQRENAMTATSLRAELLQLEAERGLVLAANPFETDELSELDEEIAATHSAYVGAAVTEIAVLRAELSGRLEG